MPVFAMPVRWRDVLFSRVAPLGRRRRLLGATAVLLALLTIKLPFFSFSTGTTGTVMWSGLDVIAFLRSMPTKPLPPVGRLIVSTPWKMDPLFLGSVIAAYGLLAVYAIGLAIPALRRLLAITAPLAVIAVLGVTRGAEWPFVTLVPVRPGSGVYALLVLTLFLWVLPLMKSLDE